MEPPTAHIPEFNQIKCTNCLLCGLVTDPAKHEIRWHQNCVLVWLRNRQKREFRDIKPEVGDRHPVSVDCKKPCSCMERLVVFILGDSIETLVGHTQDRIDLIPKPNLLQIFETWIAWQLTPVVGGNRDVFFSSAYI